MNRVATQSIKTSMTSPKPHRQRPASPAAGGFAFAETARAILSRADRHLLVLALLPVALWMANPNLLFNPPFTIDTWVYFGYFRNLVAYKSAWFPHLYFGSRLTWVLPGYLLHRIFEVVTAECILHGGVYLLATVSIYWLLSQAIGRKSALLTAILFGSQPAILLATSWDYVDGVGCAYMLAALACAFRAGTSLRPRPWLFVTAVATSGMLYTNLVLLLFFPGVLAFFVFAPRPARFDWTLLRRALSGASWIGAGMCAVTVVLAFINHALDGTYFFYAPSLAYAVSTVGKTNVWSKTDLSWVAGAYWLVLPGGGVVSSLVFLAVGRLRSSLRWNDTRVLFSANYLACFAAMLVWELNKGYCFEYGFYVSYLLPPLFLALGAQSFGPSDVWRKGAFWPVVAAAGIVLVVPFRLIGHSLMRAPRPDLFALTAIIGGVLIVRIWWPKRRLALLMVGLAFGWAHYVLIVWGWASYLQAPRAGNPAILRRIAKGVEAVRAESRDERPRFWYNRSEEYGAELWAINAAYLWEYTSVSYKFPEIADRRAPEPDSLVVILSALPEDKVLNQAASALAPLGLSASLISRKDIESRYFLNFVRIHDARSEPLRSIDAGPGEARLAPAPSEQDLPADRWILAEYPGSRSERARTSEGVLITTAPHHDAYGAKYGPLRAPKDGLYRFALTYRLRRGSLVFGALAGDESHWVAHGTPLSWGGEPRRDIVSLHLKAGEQIVLLTCNGASEASVYELLSLRATVAVGR